MTGRTMSQLHQTELDAQQQSAQKATARHAERRAQLAEAAKTPEEPKAE